MADRDSYPLDLPESLQELTVAGDWPLRLPITLQKLVLGDHFTLPITFPPGLVELEIGSEYNKPLKLPSALKRLTFALDSRFNRSIDLPPALRSIDFGNSYDQPTVLPAGIEELRIGPAFTHDLSLPHSLRTIEWCCNTSIQIPEGVCEMMFGSSFDQPVLLPDGLKKVTFSGRRYSHPVNLPIGLEEFGWSPTEHDDFEFPESLQKLTWASSRNVRLPSGLTECIIQGDAPLVFPEGLLKVTFDCSSRRHYFLPNSVQEVSWFVYANRRIFTHPATLQHLILRSSEREIDLYHNRIHKLTIGNRHIRISNGRRS